MLFTLDAEVLVSSKNLLKVNLALCSLWASGLILVKPRTDPCKTERQDNSIVPFTYIPAIAGEVNRAFDKLQKLLRNTRGNRLLAVHHSGILVTQGSSKDVDEYVARPWPRPAKPVQTIITDIDLNFTLQ